MVKIDGSKKRKLSKINVNFTKIVKIYNVCGNRGEYAICIIGFEEDGRP